MFSIQKEIEKIVLDQDFVVLPGIGGFISEYTKPYFDSKGEIVLPVKQIAFNSLIDKDLDQKLISLLQKNLKIPADFISSEYYDFLNKFRTELVLNKKYNWEGLGLFYKSSSGEIDFYPEVTADLEPQLNNFQQEKVEEIEEIEEIPVEEEVEKEFIQRKNWNLPKALLYIIPVFLLSTGLAYTIFFKPGQNKLEKKSMVEEIDSLTLASENLDSENTISGVKQNEPVVKLEKEVISNEPLKNETQASASTSSKKLDEPENKSGKQHIVSIGVFKNKDNADNLASYLAENGFPVRVRTKNGKIKMYIAANSEAQALEFVSKLEQLTGEKPVYDYN